MLQNLPVIQGGVPYVLSIVSRKNEFDKLLEKSLGIAQYSSTAAHITASETIITMNQDPLEEAQ